MRDIVFLACICALLTLDSLCGVFARQETERRSATAAERFTTRTEGIDEQLKKSTIGLVTLEDFRRTRSELEEGQRRAAAQKAKDDKKREGKKEKKRKAAGTSKLSFQEDDEEDGGDDRVAPAVATDGERITNGSEGERLQPHPNGAELIAGPQSHQQRS